MKIAGIVAEYNPFHEGHALHIRETRALTGCDFVIAVMSGSFVQRGRAAAFDKFDRAKAALLCGADAVFELPALYVLQSAEGFAAAGTGILARLGADEISCGVERDALSVADRLPEDEPEAVSRAVKARLDTGEPYAAAWGRAMADHLSVPEELLRKPNLILMREYRRAAKAYGIPVRAVPRDSGYHETGEGALSAEAVRDFLAAGDAEAAKRLLPVKARFQADGGGIDAERLDAALLWRLRSLSHRELAETRGCVEGLEYRIFDAVRSAGTVAAAADSVKSKRYTRSRIDRLLLNAALGITEEFAAAHPAPEYARLVGFRREASPLLTELHARAGGFLISDPKVLREDAVFQIENRATDLRNLCRSEEAARACGADYGTKMILA